MHSWNTDILKMVCKWPREICYGSCLPVLSDPAWVLHSNVLQTFFGSSVARSPNSAFVWKSCMRDPGQPEGGACDIELETGAGNALHSERETNLTTKPTYACLPRLSLPWECPWTLPLYIHTYVDYKVGPRLRESLWQRFTSSAQP